MKTVISKYNSKQRFFVEIKESDLNKKGEIYPHIILEQLERALISPIKQIEETRNITATRSSCIYKVDIFGSAKLGEKLEIQIQLGKYDNESAIFHLSSTKDLEGEQNADLICKASFSYKLETKSKSPKMAS